MDEELRLSSIFASDLASRQRSLTLLAATMPLARNGLSALLARRNVARVPQSALRHLSHAEGLRNGSSHFEAPAFSWFNPTEPQATAAFVQQINSGTKLVRTARANALAQAALSSRRLNALGTPICSRLLLDGPLEVTPEWSTNDGKRVDIVGRGRTNNAAVEIVIEAKFGHHITDRQLEAYTSDQREASPENQVLVVVAPKLTPADARQILRASSDRPATAPWRFVDWRTFLIAYSCALQSAHDDEEFKRLRHSLYSHARRWI